ncbi:hypothetical protein pb186bvf_013138 [Paramecium bursaria]
MKKNKTASLQNRLSSTQPQTQRQNDCECERKECILNKWTIQQLGSQINNLRLEVEKYRSLYIKERKTIGDTYKEVEKIMEGIQKKDKQLRLQQQAIKQQQLKNQQLEQQIDQSNQNLLKLKEELLQRDKKLNIQQSDFELEKEAYKQHIQEWEQYKKNLTETLNELEQRKIAKLENLEQLEKQELDINNKIAHLNLFTQNYSQHESNLEQIQKLLSEKQIYIGNLQSNLITKTEEMISQDQQLSLRQMCTSMNEAALLRRLGTQTDRIQTSQNSNCFKTPKDHHYRAQQINNYFKNPEVENQIISTIGSRENSPQSSFKIIKKNFSQRAMQEINNAERFY